MDGHASAEPPQADGAAVARARGPHPSRVRSHATLDVTVPADIPEAPQTGIYRIDAEGGDAELFAAGDDMRFPNGIHVEGDNLFVTDSLGGAVFQVALADGAVTRWVQHDELLPLADSCGPAAVRLGANGTVKLDGPASLEILTDPLRIVVTNSSFGSFFTGQTASPTLAALTVD